MKITTVGPDASVTQLVGRLSDQASLSGVLDTLYNLHLPLLRVEVMKDEDRE